MATELKLSRRSVLIGAGAVALSAVVPRDVREVWYHRGTPVIIERLPDRVNMTFMVGGVSGGLCYMKGGPPHMDMTIRRAIRRSIDSQTGYMARQHQNDMARLAARFAHYEAAHAG